MSTTLPQFIKDIREQIELDEIQPALDQLQSYVGNTPSHLQKELSLLINRLKRIQRQERQRIISFDTAQTLHTQWRFDLLSFLDEVAQQALRVTPPVSAPNIQIESIVLNNEHANLEKILGINNLKQISWIEQAILCAKSICRILTPDGAGTGFIVAPDLIMTNHHVLPNPEIASHSIAEFNYQQAPAGGHLPSYRFCLSAEGFCTSPMNKLDYSITRILWEKPDPTQSTQQEKFQSNAIDPRQWGVLSLNPNADPVPTEHVSIIQHPNGGLKQIALTANQVVNIQQQYLYYTTDTMPGSSGSPVFNDLWQVIAIHRSYGGLKEDPQGKKWYVNQGVLMSQIKKDLGHKWPGL